MPGRRRPTSAPWVAELLEHWGTAAQFGYAFGAGALLLLGLALGLGLGLLAGP